RDSLQERPVNNVLSKEDIERYERDGILYPIRALPMDEARAFRSALEELVIGAGGALKRIDNSHLFFRWAYDLVTHPCILGVVESLIGSNILVHSSRIFYKRPRTPDYVSWHQDGRYSGLNAYSAHTAWIALSDSHTGNGCLKVVAGSHREGVYPKIEKYD